MRFSQARFAILLAAMLGLTGCQSSGGSNWWRFGKSETGGGASMVNAPPHKPALPSSTASQNSLANAPGQSTATGWNGGAAATTAANSYPGTAASYNPSTYPSTGSSAATNPYAQHAAANYNSAVPGNASPATPQSGYYGAAGYGDSAASTGNNYASTTGYTGSGAGYGARSANNNVLPSYAGAGGSYDPSGVAAGYSQPARGYGTSGGYGASNGYPASSSAYGANSVGAQSAASTAAGAAGYGGATNWSNELWIIAWQFVERVCGRRNERRRFFV
jgi:hypothetical protein